MEKIVPGASAMKAKSSKKDQYLLKRRDAPEASAAHRQPQLPDAPPPAPPAPAPALDDGPPGFPASGDPPTPPLPGSSVADEDFMLQRRAPLVEVPPAAQAQPTDGPANAAAAAPKKATKPKKPRKREREEGGDADASPDAVDAAAAADPKKRKKKKKLSDLDGAGAGAGKAAVVQDPNGLDLTQVLSDIRNLPLAPFHGADHRRISDTARSFVLAFRSKYYKKSYENDPPEESKKGLDKPSAAAAAAADGQSPKKKKPAAPRPGAGNDPTKAGVKRRPSDRQGELAVKKKAKLDKIKTLSSEKKAGGLGLEQKDTTTAVAAAQQQQARAASGAKDSKAEMGGGAPKKKEPAAAPRVRTPSPTALMMKFPLKSTLPSVASLKARFARFGPLDVDGIRVYWKSHMCRVIYRFKSDAEAALRYAKANAMFGQVDTQYHLREVESGAALPPAPATEAPPQQQRSELRLMETAPFRPGSGGNGAPLPMSRAGAVPAARPAVGQPPKSILKKSTDEGNSGATTREVSRVKFMLDGADGGGKLEPPASGGGGNGGADTPVVNKAAKSVGFASSSSQPPLQPPPRTLLQPPMRPALPQQQPPRAAVTQQQFPPLPLQQQQHLPYHQPPRVGDGPPPLVSPQGQLLAYPPPRGHGEGPSALPGLPPPYQPRPAGFPGGHQQQQQQMGYPPRSGDSPPVLAGQQQQFPPRPVNANATAAEEVPAWKRSEKEFKEELWRVMTGIAKMVEPLTDKNGFFPYHLFRAQ